MGFRPVRQILVDGDFCQVRPEDVRARLQDDRYQRNDYLQPIGTQIGQQAFHQPAVIRFAQYFFFVDGGHAY